MIHFLDPHTGLGTQVGGVSRRTLASTQRGTHAGRVKTIGNENLAGMPNHDA